METPEAAVDRTPIAGLSRDQEASDMTAVVARDGDLLTSGGELPDVPIPARCPRCTAEARSDLVRRSLYVCDCSYHFPLSADAWIALLADAGSWSEHWSELRAADILRWTAPVPYEQALARAEALGLNESVRVGSCDLDRSPLWLAVFDFRFLG